MSVLGSKVVLKDQAFRDCCDLMKIMSSHICELLSNIHQTINKQFHHNSNSILNVKMNIYLRQKKLKKLLSIYNLQFYHI